MLSAKMAAILSRGRGVKTAPGLAQTLIPGPTLSIQKRSHNLPNQDDPWASIVTILLEMIVKMNGL